MQGDSLTRMAGKLIGEGDKTVQSGQQGELNDFLERVRKEVEELLKGDPCDVKTKEQLEKAFQIAQDARATGQRGDEALGWATSAARSYIVTQYGASGSSQSAQLAQLARTLGFDDMWEDILDNRSLDDDADKCKKGFTARLEGTGEKVISDDVTGQWIATVNVSTCAEDPRNALWKGTWTWDWKSFFSGRQMGKDGGSRGIQFQTVGGSAQFSLAGLGASASVTSSNMTVSYEMPNVGQIEIPGPISKGGSDCPSDQ